MLSAFKSLDKNTHCSHIHTIIGLHNFAQTIIFGFSLSIIANA
ncbi:MAG: hypothetical protein Q8S84_07610 [bacterium]|nr:hypothetical protein [bacterium]MDP3381311.1 hypothetical protein [bacterium]